MEINKKFKRQTINSSYSTSVYLFEVYKNSTIKRNWGPLYLLQYYNNRAENNLYTMKDD